MNKQKVKESVMLSMTLDLDNIWIPLVKRYFAGREN